MIPLPSFQILISASRDLPFDLQTPKVVSFSSLAIWTTCANLQNNWLAHSFSKYHVYKIGSNKWMERWTIGQVERKHHTSGLFRLAEAYQYSRRQQRQLRSVARELISFWRFESARVDPIKLAYDLHRPDGRLC